MNIKLYKTNPGIRLQARRVRLQRRFTISSHRFLNKCIDLINNYEVIQVKYKQLFSRDTLSVISEVVYRERFVSILLMNSELVDAYGKHVDQFINCSRDIMNTSKSDKIYFEHIVDVHLMMQKEYLTMVKLYKLPFSVEKFSSDNTSVVNIPAESIRRYTGSKKSNRR